LVILKTSRLAISKLPDYQITRFSSMASNSQMRRKPPKSGEDGYILLTLLLIIALATIAAATLVTELTFDIKRDREEELIHRGVQYSRAIRAYYKKFGRYPTKIEDLESTNNLRFLRKRYKDPMNCKPECQDFKLLHFGEVKLTFSGGIGGGGINGATNLNNPTTFGTPPPQPGGGLNPNGGLGNPPNGIGGGQTPYGSPPNNPTDSSNSTATPDQSQNGNTDSSGQTSGPQPGQQPGQQQPGSPIEGDKLSNTTFGGGPIVGVVSSSKKETIREFNHKKKYNEWQFIYDPGTDRGGLLMTPNQPPIMGFGQQQGTQNVNGQNGQNGTSNGSTNGFGNGFGSAPTGIQNNPNPPATTPPTSDPNNPPQQQ
jgi:type II secretory pathway pseudopilin PulG